MRAVPVLCVLLAILAVPFGSVSTAQEVGACLVPRGHDLFVTIPHTYVGLPPHVHQIHYAGVPPGSFDFGGAIGVRPTGETDTIVARLRDATPAAPTVPIELVLLQLESYGVPFLPTHYVTLQTRRAADELPGVPRAASTGALTIRFDPGCAGGTLDSEITVAFDVRDGGIAGPILASGTDTIQAANVPWAHADDVTRALEEQGRIALHRVRDAAARVEGVNDKLNGVDDAADFHPGFPL